MVVAAIDLQPRASSSGENCERHMARGGDVLGDRAVARGPDYPHDNLAEGIPVNRISAAPEGAGDARIALHRMPDI
jgi:hypothetical protein